MKISNKTNIYNRQKQKYSGHYESEIIDMGTPTVSTVVQWITDLPFMKELPRTSESSTDYSLLVDENGDTEGDGGTPDLMNGIVGIWHLNELASSAGAYNDALDSSGNGFHGEFENEATSSYGQKGKLGQAYSFDGFDDYIEIQDNDDLTVSDFTISAWIKRDSFTGDHTIVEKYGAGNKEYSLYITSSGQIV